MKTKLKQLETKISELMPDPPKPEELRLMAYGRLGCTFSGPVTLEVDPCKPENTLLVFRWCKAEKMDCEGCEYNHYEEACLLIREGREEEAQREGSLVMQVEEVNPRLWRVTVWEEKRP